MHAVTLGMVTDYPSVLPRGSRSPPPNASAPGITMSDPAQIQQLVQLLSAKMIPKQTAIVDCPKSMVGRVIGKGGETIKALQQYTGAMIQIDQSTDPTRVTIAGSPQSLQLAVSMVHDIVRGTFKGFAMLRQIAIAHGLQPAAPLAPPVQPVYVQGYGFVPPSQAYGPEDTLAAASGALRGSPTGPLTPPMTPLRTAGGLGGLSAETLAALLSGQGLSQTQRLDASQGEHSLFNCFFCRINHRQECRIVWSGPACPLLLLLLPSGLETRH
jgi:hypothetical protein